jgi:hypothetical protein
MLNILKKKEKNEISKEEVIQFFLKYVTEELEVSRRKSSSEDSFNKPSWSEFQAYQLGIQKMCQNIINLIPDQGKDD